MYWWVHQYPVSDAAKVDQKSAIQAYQYFRDICSWRLLNRDAPLMIGGPPVIDESLFRHKPKGFAGFVTRSMSIVSQRSPCSTRSLGVWDGGHQSVASTWSDGAGAR